MSSSSFALPFERLPPSLPIFPLPNAIVMPGCQLPLNIFEPRYLNMVFDALGAERMIGMVQPDPSRTDVDFSAVYKVGTAGRITSFSETQDGRLLIVLSGVCRFDIGDEIPTTRGYRRMTVDWTRFSGDFDLGGGEGIRDKGRLVALLKDSFQRKSWDTNWPALEQMPLPLLVNIMAGQLPLDPPERQMLVEAVSLEERTANLIRLLEFEAAGPIVPDVKRH